MTESVAAKNGDDVTLTIDRDVQWYVKKVLEGGRIQVWCSVGDRRGAGMSRAGRFSH